MRRSDVPKGRRNALSRGSQRWFDLGFWPKEPLWPVTGHNGGVWNLKRAPDPRGFIEPFRPKPVSRIPSNNMLYLLPPGTSGLPCTPFPPGKGRCVLSVGHLRVNRPVRAGSAGFLVNAAKPRSSGLKARTGHVCACYPKHQDGTVAKPPFLPSERALSTFTRSRQGRRRTAARRPNGPPSYRGWEPPFWPRPRPEQHVPRCSGQKARTGL